MNPLAGRAVYAIATLVLGEHAVFRHLATARETRQLPLSQLRERQRHALATLFRWARERSPHYMPLLSSWSPDADPLEMLRSIPPLEKRVLQDGVASIRSTGFRGRLIGKSTGGSTGAPIRIVKDSGGIAREMAASWAALESYGIRIGDRSARFWGTPLTRGRRIRFRLTDLAMNRVRLSAFDLDDNDMAAYWRRCLSFRPVWLYGYASLIHLFARWIEERGENGARLGLRAVVPTSEPLLPEQRATISRVFAAPVFDEYGCGEVGAIAYACRSGRLHVVTDNVVVEVVDSELNEVPAGTAGEILVTDLTNFGMPLIRYRVGDRAVPAAGCDCGSEAPALERILGRIHDVVYTPAGRRWHGEKLDYLMSQLFGQTGAFRQYQVVQRTASDLLVRLVADQEIPDEVKGRISEYVAERLDGMRTEVVRVERIEREQSGKIRLVRNEYLPNGMQPHAD